MGKRGNGKTGKWENEETGKRGNGETGERENGEMGSKSAGGERGEVLSLRARGCGEHLMVLMDKRKG